MKHSDEGNKALAGSSPENDLEQLRIQIAKLFYELGFTQSEIGKRIGLNRWQVSRHLREARADGTIRIEISPRGNRLPHKEASLQKRFGLRDAIVCSEQYDEDVTLNLVAQVATRYLTNLQLSSTLVGVSWGRTMTKVASWLPTRWAHDVNVVLLNGATNIHSNWGLTNNVAAHFAQAGNGRATLLPVPAILGDPSTREALENDAIIARILELAEAAPIAVMSMGTTQESSVLVSSGYLDTEEINVLNSRGAVGDILGRFVDADGHVAVPEFDDRTLGLPPEQLRAKAYSIGVAVGASKHQVVRACIVAGYINVLITDSGTARFLLGEDGDE